MKIERFQVEQTPLGHQVCANCNRPRSIAAPRFLYRVIFACSGHATLCRRCLRELGRQISEVRT